MGKKIEVSKSAINYGIRIKLLLGFLVVLLLTLLVGGVGYYGVYKINKGAEDVGGHWLKATSSLAQVVEDTEDTRRTLLAGFTMRADAKCSKTIKHNSWTLKPNGTRILQCMKSMSSVRRGKQVV